MTAANGMPLRVVSLVPSLTETLLALGVRPIACTRFCEQPTLAHVGGTKDPDIGAIVSLAPDVVLVDREENRREDADALTAHGIDVFATHVVRVADVEPMIEALRRRLGIDANVPGDGHSRAGRLDTPSGHDPRRAFVAIWRRPWMTISAATYGSSLLGSLGIVNVFADHPTTYPTVSLDEAAARAPDIVILPSEPYPFKQRHVAEIAMAVPGAEIHLVDGRDLFWWGSRTRSAASRLAHAVGVNSS